MQARALAAHSICDTLLDAHQNADGAAPLKLCDHDGRVESGSRHFEMVLCSTGRLSWQSHVEGWGRGHLNCRTSNVQSSRMTTVPPTCVACRTELLKNISLQLRGTTTAGGPAPHLV